MKRVSLSIFLIYMLFISCCSSVKENESSKEQEKSPVPSIEVKAQTDRTTATVADPITYTLSVLYVPEIKVRMPEVGSHVAGLRIVDFGEEGPAEIDNRLEYKKWYKLRADIAGAYIIPSMAVSYTDKHGTKKELKTPQIFIEVKTTLIDEKGEALKDIIDIKPLQEVKRDLTPYILFGAVALVLIISVVGVLFYIDRKQKKARKVKKPAHIIALEELEKLRKEKLIEKGVLREHYFRLSDIFRRYIENRFGVPAVEQTTQELLPEIGKLRGLTTSVKSKAREFLIHSDLIKFAKYAPAQEEMDHNHENVTTVINETKQEETISENYKIAKKT